jgi:hypothetical protein
MSAALKALTPQGLSHVTFREHKLRGDFRDWCNQNPNGAFRLFSIRGTGRTEPPAVTNTDVEWVSTEIECVIAYPLDYRAGPQLTLDRDDLIEDDLRQIDNTIGTNGYLAIENAGAGVVVTIETRREEGIACAFGVLTMSAGFWRAMP